MVHGEIQVEIPNAVLEKLKRGESLWHPNLKVITHTDGPL